MEFEMCMRRIFGDEANHIAGGCLMGSYRKNGYRSF